MSAKALIIPTIFTSVDQMTPTQLKMAKGVEGFALRAEVATARAERAFKKLTPALGSASKQLLSMAGTAALVGGAFALGRSSVKSVMEYETALQSLQAVTGVSNTEMVNFKKEINDLAATSKKSSIDVSASFETIGSAMSQYLDDPKGLRQIAEAGITLSKAARTELQPTLEDLTSIMNQFGLKASEAAKSVDILTAGEIVGSIRTSEASGYLKDFGATAKNMGVDLAESTALIEALGIQMSKDKIGTGARNLLTIISAAGGLDKKARSDLKSSGVSMKFLMDSTQSLSSRLKELSKIAKDPIKMVSVFGKENLTAGQVIFNQLARYDEFEAKIRVTSKAQEQAALNSDTLSNAIAELKNSWVNLLTGSTAATSGLLKAKDAIHFVTANLDTIVSVGINVLKFYALFKGALIVSRAALIGYNIVYGINNALQQKSLFYTEGNIIAKNADLVTTKAVTAATWLWNAALEANPIGLLIVSVAALAGGLMYLKSRHEELVAQYEKEIHLKAEASITGERKSINELALSYQRLGLSKKEALATSLALRRQSIKLAEISVQEKIANNEQYLKEHNSVSGKKYKLFDEFSDTYHKNQEELVANKKRAADLANKNLGLTQETKSAVDLGLLDRTQGIGILNKQVTKSSGKVLSPEELQKQQLEQNRIKQMQMLQEEGMNFGSTKVAAAQHTSTTNNAEANATVTIKNDSNSSVDISNGQTRAFSVMPNMSSTMSTKK